MSEERMEKEKHDARRAQIIEAELKGWGEVSWDDSGVAVPDETSVAELQARCEKLMELKANAEELGRKKTEAEGAYKAARMEMLKIMRACNLERFDGESGSLFIRQKSSVRVPRSPEDREAFFDYLKARGVFEDLVTVNSNTLNSRFREWEEEALDNGVVDFRVPGLEPATIYEDITVKGKK